MDKKSGVFSQIARHRLSIFGLGLTMGFGLAIGLMNGPEGSIAEFDRHTEISPTFLNSVDARSWAKSMLGTRVMPLDRKLEAVVRKTEDAHPGTEISVYVRDLASGFWFGHREDDAFHAGSLMKVPLVIGFLKAAEVQPAILDQVVTVNAEATRLFEVQSVQPREKVQAGQSYSVRELIRRTIVYSDNAAALTLEKLDRHSYLQRTAIELNVPIRDGVAPKRQVTLREYAKFFLSLYNSTYLSPEDSNELLGLLAKSDYHDGLAKRLPETLKVAHKFGESSDQSTTTYYLTDCGIVYFPGSPYLICASAKSKKLVGLEVGVQDVSADVYRIFAEARTQAELAK